EDGIRDLTVTGVQTCLFRSRAREAKARGRDAELRIEQRLRRARLTGDVDELARIRGIGPLRIDIDHETPPLGQRARRLHRSMLRSEERRVGKGCSSPVSAAR